MEDEYLRAGYLIGFPLGVALAYLIVRFVASPVDRLIKRRLVRRATPSEDSE